LKKNWPEVEVIALPKNLGFAAAMNRGIEGAKTPFIALLNNDLELAKDWMAVMVRTLKSQSQAGMVSGKILEYRNRKRFDGTGEVVSWYGTFTPRGHGEIDKGQFDKAGWVFGPMAAAAMYRRKLFQDVGLFDERFFAYAEDTDLHFRAQLKGFKAYYTPKTKAFHMVSATSKRNPSYFARYLVNRNRCLLILKNFPTSRLLRHSIKLSLFSAKTLVGAIRDQYLGTLLKAWGKALLYTPLILIDRWRIQHGRKVPVEYLDSIVTSRVPVKSRWLGRRS
jgi:GT2 family glycosyltransferase